MKWGQRMGTLKGKMFWTYALVDYFSFQTEPKRLGLNYLQSSKNHIKLGLCWFILNFLHAAVIFLSLFKLP